MGSRDPVEIEMDGKKQLSKEVVREWLIRRYIFREPLPSPDEIRIQLGWIERVHPDSNASSLNHENGSRTIE
jgi:hypothetical protein